MPVSTVFFFISHGILNKQGLLIQQNVTFLKVPVKEPPTMVLQGGPYGERCPVFRASGIIIHSYLSVSPVRSHQQGENIWSPSTEPNAFGRPTYNRVRPGFPRGSFTTLLLLPQCHSAFITYLPPWLG